jgi:DNA adenine methylase
MKYMGSKRRLKNHLLPTILKDRKPGQWYVEPFVGGANMIEDVENPRLGADNNRYIIAFLDALQDGWEPAPEAVSFDFYQSVNNNMTDYPDHVVGYVGFCFTYGAKFFGGYIGSVNDVVCEGRDRIGESYRAARKQRKTLLSNPGIEFVHSSYDQLEIPEGSIIYCDPPYANTTKYKTGEFDHDAFWQWCRDKASEGNRVFVSEYSAPDDFICVWQKEIVSSLTKDTGSKKGTEKLFVHESQLQ